MRKIRYFFHNLRWWNLERFKFQLYLWKIGGINAGYFTRPNDYYYPFRVMLFDFWNWLFVDKILFTKSEIFT